MNRPIRFRDEYHIIPSQKEIVEKIFVNSGCWIGIINAKSGIGKTMTACKVAKMSYDGYGDRASEVASKFMFISAFMLGKKLKLAGLDFDSIITNYATAYCLVIDDLGGETDDTIPYIEEVIYQLDNNCGQLIFTSALTRMQLATRYNGKVIRRIQSNGEIFELPE